MKLTVALIGSMTALANVPALAAGGEKPQDIVYEVAPPAPRSQAPGEGNTVFPSESGKRKIHLRQ